MPDVPYGRCCQSTSRRSSRTSGFALIKAMKLQVTRYQMEQTALALGARLKTLRQWRQRGWTPSPHYAAQVGGYGTNR
jgi:hypothetical protein